jgi:hypothetical protein
MKAGTALTLIASIALTACEFNGPCTTSVEPGLIVRVVDSATGAAAAHEASGLAVDDEYQETLRNPAPEDTAAELLYGADEREGIYTVSVAKSGYRPWVREEVRVTGDECHVRTVNLEARLIPNP